MKRKPLSQADVIREFKKYKIQFDGKVITFKPGLLSQLVVHVELSELEEVSLKKSVAMWYHVVVFWGIRIMTWSDYLKDTLTPNVVDYRFNYDLIFRLKDGTRYVKVISRFDMFMNKRILEYLNCETK